MKIIVTIIPTDLVTNSPLSSFLSFLTNQKQESDFQQVSGLVTRNIRVVLYFKAMSISIDFFLHVVSVRIIAPCYNFPGNSFVKDL